MLSLWALAGCGDGEEAIAPSPDTTEAPDATGAPDTPDPTDGEGLVEPQFPDVVGVSASRDDDGSWTFEVTLSSPYDGPERYADAWRIVGPDGEVYGIRELAHDHSAEQPFTRGKSGIIIPDGVATVTVEGRDQLSGWGGATMQYQLEP
jgi:hypothetical protein